MIKPLALAALALTLPFIPAALGCSSSTSGGGATGDDTTGQHDSGSTNDAAAGNHDSGQTLDSATGSDTGTGNDSSTGGTCPADTSSFTGTPYATVTPQPNVCSSTEIQAFIAVCGDNYDETACGNWFMATDAGAGDACGACITGTSTTASNGAIYEDAAGMNFGPNYGACIALTDATHGTACGTAFNNFSDCVSVACDTCSDDTSYGTCVTTEEGASGTCASFGMAAQTGCSSDSADGGALDTCQPGGGTAQDPDWTYIINLICGTGQ